MTRDEFAKQVLSKYNSPYGKGEKLSDTYTRTVKALVATGECESLEAKRWTGDSLHQYLKDIGVLK